MAPRLPDDWHEVEDVEHIVGKYRARNPTLFVREGHDVGVHVLDVATSSPHDEERFRAGAVRGDRDEFDYEHVIDTFEDRERAFEAALSFANRYEEAYEARHDEEAALETAAEAVA